MYVVLDPAATTPPPMPLSEMLWMIRALLIGSAAVGAFMAVASTVILLRDRLRPSDRKLSTRIRLEYWGSGAGGLMLAVGAPVLWVVLPL